jgi:hypothetical protein
MKAKIFILLASLFISVSAAYGTPSDILVKLQLPVQPADASLVGQTVEAHETTLVTDSEESFYDWIDIIFYSPENQHDPACKTMAIHRKLGRLEPHTLVRVKEVHGYFYFVHIITGNCAQRDMVICNIDNPLHRVK